MIRFDHYWLVEGLGFFLPMGSYCQLGLKFCLVLSGCLWRLECFWLGLLRAGECVPNALCMGSVGPFLASVVVVSCFCGCYLADYSVWCGMGSFPIHVGKDCVVLWDLLL